MLWLAILGIVKPPLESMFAETILVGFMLPFCSIECRLTCAVVQVDLDLRPDELEEKNSTVPEMALGGLLIFKIGPQAVDIKRHEVSTSFQKQI